MATFTALAKTYSIKYFYNTKVPGLGKIFVKQKFPAIQYMLTAMPTLSGVAKGGPSRARPDQSSVVPYQMMFNYLPLYTLNICTYR